MEFVESPVKNGSFVHRFVESIANPGWKWHTATLCRNPECKRRSVRYSFSRRIEGLEIAGHWFCSPACYEDSLRRQFSMQTFATRVAIPAHRARIPLGLMLLSRNDLTQEQLRTALARHRTTGARLGDVVLELGYVNEERLTAALAAQWGYPVFPSNTGISWMPVRLPSYLLELYSIMPVHFVEGSRRLLLGFADGPDHRILPIVRRLLNCEVDPCFITLSEYRRRLRSMKGDNEMHEVVFDRACQPAEMVRVTSSYARQIGARRVDFAGVRDHLWVRLSGCKHGLDLLFRADAS